MPAHVIDLESYRGKRLESAAESLASDEFATGRQLVATWTDALQKFSDPTCAHLAELASAVDDLLEADDYESMRCAALQIVNGARSEMAERLRRGKR